MKDAVHSLFGILAMLIATGWLVVGLSEIVPPSSRKSSTDEYQQECLRIGGKPLWNGRHFDCLKEAKT